MRILHTADWHLGRTLEGRSRQEEHEQFVDELCRLVREEAIDLVLIAGDIFDSYNPPAAAEELFCEALARLGDGGRRAVVVIAGNHDSPERLTAVRALARRHGVVLFGYPREDPGVVGPLPEGPVPGAAPEAGRVRWLGGGPGWVEVAVAGVDHTAVVLAVPYLSEARLSEALAETLAEADLQAAYSRRVGALFGALAAARYRPDCVRLAMAHLYVAGGQESESERPIQMGGAYTVDPADLPAGAQYIALGHLHRPQAVAGAPALTRYAGSPLAFSFSEAGQTKSVTVLDLRPDDPAPTARQILLSAGRPLARWCATAGIRQVERWVAEGRDPHAWIDLEVHVTRPLTMDEIQSLRRMHPGFVYIRPVIAAAEVAATREAAAPLTLAEQFRRFYRQRTGGGEPDPELVRLFLELATAEDGGEVPA